MGKISQLRNFFFSFFFFLVGGGRRQITEMHLCIIWQVGGRRKIKALQYKVACRLAERPSIGREEERETKRASHTATRFIGDYVLGRRLSGSELIFMGRESFVGNHCPIKMLLALVTRNILSQDPFFFSFFFFK